MLPEEKRQQLDGIVQQMVSNKESDSNIKFVVDDFKQKYSVQENEAPQEQKPNLLGKASNILGTVFGGKRIGEAIGTQIAKATVPEEQKQFISEGPTVKQIAGDVAGTGLTLATLGGAGLAGGLGARLIKMAGLGAGISGSQSLADGGDASDVAKSAVAGGAVGAALPVAGAGLRAIGGQIKQLPERFVNSALSRKKADILKDIAKDKTDDFANYVLKSKPVGTASKLLSESTDNVSQLGQKVSSALSLAERQTGGKITIGRNNILDEVVKLPEAEGALLKRVDVRSIIERLAPQSKKLLQKESLTLTEANKLRQLLDKTLGDRAFLGSQISSDKAVLKSFANTLREQVKSKAPEGTRALFSELSNEIRFRDALLERIAKKQGNQVLSFGDFIGGGLGGIFGGGIPGAVGGVAARRAIESVPFKLSAGKLTNAATKLEPVIKDMTPAQQTAILNFFSEIFSENDQQKDPESELEI